MRNPNAVFIPADIVAFAGFTSDTVGAIAGSNLCIVGFSAAENNGASAELVIRHGSDASGGMIARINLAPGESTREWWGPEGIRTPNGIFLDWISGDMDITIFKKQPEL